ncbi:MAG TPA: hypothetical protein ENN05_04475 [Deltaproteobacteria bacterium]|nr:hypothetical protein [Deltaproteobacteria bacterium]
MMEVLDFFRQHPFLLGLAIGLLIAAGIWIKGLFRARVSNKEIEKLKESLYTKMQIDTKGHMTRENELEQLRKHNENLRVSLKSLQQKPGRAEVRQLHVYDKAIHSMLAKAPGFAPTWEMVLNDAEDEIRQTETGISAFVRKVFIPGKSLPKNTEEVNLIDYEENKEE